MLYGETRRLTTYGNYLPFERKITGTVRVH
jgi:hypothetical protein